ncbi:RNA 2',3'-cyclic phosphodiesterase [Lentibacillus kapialis]|uniref:RNA 2',3'-cyclic phosphodiesterase n=1 Tax=Lentibacillus kapialis TaxID=340214 RepID=A0A917Q206_9BACI|nr:RNA 2',3'-cyclic phosphodiesterase [Lentibacillus kapialis]GGK06747.1 RNA 2',3'-cyclic phosphodiesterase [Lentibacillus kapialis]
MNFPHYFIAIPLPDSHKQLYAAWQQKLKNKLCYKQWPHPEDLHITLTFLGAVDETKLEALTQIMHDIENIPAFSLETGKLGTFGNPKKPRVLWADVERKRELVRLQEYVEDIALRVGFQPEKRAYNPHITLAKKCSGGNENFSDLKEHYTGQYRFNVKQVVIYRIHPEKNPKYHVTAIYNLAA